MRERRSRGKAIGAPVQNVQARAALPRDAGEDKGGGLNDLNFLNELNECQGSDLTSLPGEFALGHSAM